MKLMSVAALAAAIVLAAALAGVGRPGAAHGSAAPAGRTVTVNGSATARGKPDTAVFSLGVDSDGSTASAATSANAEQMNKVIAALLDAGVARADIQTENVSVYAQRNGSGAIDGYNASNSVSVTVRQLAKAGATVDAAVAAGANETSGPQFERSGTALYQQALRDAFANARAKAETLAQEASASLGEVRRIDEGGQPLEPVPLVYGAEKAAAATPIQPGTQQVQASVTVTFSLS